MRWRLGSVHDAFVTTQPTDHVYKILREAEANVLETYGRFAGSEADEADGFVHLCLAHQLPSTLAAHFTGESVKVLALNAAELGEALRYERSRDGALFPHLYGAILPPMIADSFDVPWDDEEHSFETPPSGALELVGPFAALRALVAKPDDAQALAMLAGTGDMELRGEGSEALTALRDQSS